MAPHTPQHSVLRLLLTAREGLRVRLGPLEPFLQLLLRLLDEVERLRAMAVVVMGGLLQLFLRALEVAVGGKDVRVAAGPRRALLGLWRWRRRRRRRLLRRDGGGDQHGGERRPEDPEMSSHDVPSFRLSMRAGRRRSRERAACAPNCGRDAVRSAGMMTSAPAPIRRSFPSTRSTPSPSTM